MCVEFVIDGEKFEWTKNIDILTESIDGKPCLVFHNTKTGENQTKVCQSEAQSNDLKSQVRQKLIDEGFMQERIIKIKTE